MTKALSFGCVIERAAPPRSAVRRSPQTDCHRRKMQRFLRTVMIGITLAPPLSPFEALTLAQGRPLTYHLPVRHSLGDVGSRPR